MALAYEEIRARRITPDTTVPQHDFLFRWGNQPCYARGELVALTGKAKSGKTFVCSILMALGIRPQLMGLSRLHDEPLRVVWIDTEQSEDSTREILCHRIGSLIGGPIPDDQYFVYNLRRDNWQDRLAWAELCIVQAKPDLVIFDGIRDVVGDINNYTEAQTVLDKLLSLASWSRACIVCVLHQNKAIEDKTLRASSPSAKQPPANTTSPTAWSSPSMQRACLCYPIPLLLGPIISIIIHTLVRLMQEV